MDEIKYTEAQINSLPGHQAYDWARTLNNGKNFFTDEELRENPYDALRTLLSFK